MEVRWVDLGAGKYVLQKKKVCHCRDFFIPVFVQIVVGILLLIEDNLVA
jgi:hypothetical protein